MAFGEERLGRAVAELDTDQKPFDAGLAAGKRKAQSWVTDVSRTLSQAGKQISAAGRTLTMNLTLPIVAAGTAIFGVGASFEHTLSKIVGLVGVSREQINAWRPELEALSVSTGIGPGSLAKALYFVASSGVEVSKVMGVLTIAAKGAMAGMGDVEMLADVLTGSMNAYAKSNLTAANAMDILVRGIQIGKAEPAEFASSLGTIAPAAAQLKVSFADLVGTMGILSRVNSNTAENATSLAQVFNTLLSSTKETTEALADMGLSAQGLRDVLANQGPIAMLQLLASRIGDNDEAIATIFPNIRALRGVLNLMGQDGQSVAAAMAKVADNTGALNEAVNAVSGDDSVKFDQAMARIQVAMIHIGAVLGPRVALILERISEVVEDLTKKWDSLDASTQDNIVTGVMLVAVLGPVLSIIGLLTRGVGLLVAVGGALSEAVGILAFALGTTVAVAAALAGAFVVLAGLIVGLITNFNGMGTAFVNGIRLVYLAITGIVQLVLQSVHNVASALAQIPGPFQAMFQAIADGAAFADGEIGKLRQSTIEAGLASAAAAEKAAAWAAAGDAVGGSWDLAAASAKAGAEGVGDAATTIPDEISAIQAELDAASQAVADSLPNALTGAKAEAAKIVRQTLADLSASLTAGQTDWQSGWDTYKDIVKNDLTKTKEIAAIQAHLTSRAFVRNLNSADPEVRAAAEAWRKEAKDRLFALRNDVPGIARKSGVSYADALAATKKAVHDAGGKLSKAAKAQLIMDLTNAGKGVTKTWAGGLSSNDAIAAVRAAAVRAAGVAKSILMGDSPPPQGPLHTVDAGGENVAEAWWKGLTARLGDMRADLGISLRPLANALDGLAPSPSAPAMRPALAAPAGAPSAALTITGGIHLHGIGSDVSPAAAKRFGESVLDEVARGLREQTARGANR